MGFSWASVSLAGEIHPSRAGVVTLPYFCGDVLSLSCYLCWEPTPVPLFRRYLDVTPGSDLPDHAGGAGAGSVAPDRAVRQQLCRGRRRPAEGGVATDAWAQAGPQCQSHHEWACLCAEPQARTLQAGGRGAGEPAGGLRARRAPSVAGRISNARKTTRAPGPLQRVTPTRAGRAHGITLEISRGRAG